MSTTAGKMVGRRTLRTSSPVAEGTSLSVGDKKKYSASIIVTCDLTLKFEPSTHARMLVLHNDERGLSAAIDLLFRFLPAMFQVS